MRVIPSDTDEMGEGAVRCLITKSARLLMVIPVPFFCADPEQLVLTASSKSSRRSYTYPRTSLYTTWNPSLFLAYAPAHPRDALLMYGTDRPSERIMTFGTSSIDTSPIGEHLERRTSDLTGVLHFSML